MSSYATLTLDTRAPEIEIDGPATITPPEEWVGTITVDEPFGAADLIFFDAFGQQIALGYRIVDERTIEVTVPTVALAGGPGVLVVEIDDLVCNRATQTFPVFLIRVVPFDVTLTIGGPFDAGVEMDHALEADVSMTHAFVTQASVDHAFEASVEFEQPFDVSMEIADADAE